MIRLLALWVLGQGAVLPAEWETRIAARRARTFEAACQEGARVAAVGLEMGRQAQERLSLALKDCTAEAEMRRGSRSILRMEHLQSAGCEVGVRHVVRRAGRDVPEPRAALWVGSCAVEVSARQRPRELLLALHPIGICRHLGPKDEVVIIWYHDDGLTLVRPRKPGGEWGDLREADWLKLGVSSVPCYPPDAGTP